MRNADTARLFEDIADMLEVQGESPFRYNAYREAARQIAAWPTPIEELAAAGELERIPGVGKAIAAKIAEYLATGRLAYYERLAEQVPPGLVQLLQVPGVGPRTAQLLHRQLGVASLADHQRAIDAHAVRAVPGLGAKTEERLARELSRLAERTRRLPRAPGRGPDRARRQPASVARQRRRPRPAGRLVRPGRGHGSVRQSADGARDAGPRPNVHARPARRWAPGRPACGPPRALGQCAAPLHRLARPQHPPA